MSKLIVLTGATRGLGRALVPQFAAAGHTVVGCGRGEKQVAELAKKLPAKAKKEQAKAKVKAKKDAAHAKAAEMKGAADDAAHEIGGMKSDLKDATRY